MNLINPPEVADGGYWLVTQAIAHPLYGGQTPENVTGSWCAWYFDGYCVVRCISMQQPLTDAAPRDVKTILTGSGYSVKPYARIRGK